MVAGQNFAFQEYLVSLMVFLCSFTGLLIKQSTLEISGMLKICHGLWNHLINVCNMFFVIPMIMTQTDCCVVLKFGHVVWMCHRIMYQGKWTWIQAQSSVVKNRYLENTISLVR